ncbi:carbohydrate ABC transporter permease [Paenibacillus sp. DMB20]|uniref:carbohydrate ABC transporter permease n=1 Tax=Paenibacillus sp. DMB20 TaxID=1642570 RepID=UPI000A87159B
MKAFKYIAALIILIIHSIPFYILVNLSFKPIEDTSSKWMPSSSLRFENFIDAWKDAQLGRAVLNNGIVTLLAVILVVLIGACASYPLARHATRWNRFVYTLCISCLIVPALTILVPLYKFIVDVGGINTYWAIILTQVTFSLPMTIFLFTGFVSTVPRELDEAGLIDGCSRYGIFFEDYISFAEADNGYCRHFDRGSGMERLSVFRILPAEKRDDDDPGCFVGVRLAIPQQH